MHRKLQTPFAQLEIELLQLIGYLDGLSDARRHQAPPKAWNSLQILYHLKEAEKGTVGYLDAKLKTPKSQIQKGGISSQIRSILLHKNLRDNKKKFKAPPILKEMPESINYNDVRSEYFKTRQALKTILEKFETDMLNKAYFKHPVAGRITIKQTLEFLKDHFQRHLIQIMDRSGDEIKT